VDLGPAGTTHAVRSVFTDSLPPDAIAERLVRDAIASVAPLVNRRVATIAEPLERIEPQYPLGFLIADAMRDAGQGDVAVMNNGGIRTGLAAGVATYGSLFEIQPFANTLYRITVTGKALHDYLERIIYRRGQPGIHVSGLTIVYDSTAAEGSRIRSITMSSGAPLDSAARYRVILNDFMALGGEGLNFSAGAIRTEPLGIVDLDAMMAYLNKLPQPVHAPTAPRIIQRSARQ
jgi:5'-nucleotidase